MNDSNKPEGFSYTYSSKQQEEVKRIRSKYAPTSPDTVTDKMEQLRRLDAGVTKKGTVVSLILGILGTLLMGIGMSLVMTELGTLVGRYALPVGIAVGLIGILAVALAYPVYNAITKRERARIAPEILRLTEELMQ